MPSLKDFVSAWLKGKVRLAPITDLLEIQPVAVEEGLARVTMNAGKAHHNAMGTVHGGIFLDLADVAMGVALATLMEDGEGFTTLEAHASYLRPVLEARLTALARVIRRGKASAYVECEILDGDQLVAKVASTCLIRKGGAP